MQQQVFLMTYEEFLLLLTYEITLDWICFRVMDVSCALSVDILWGKCDSLF